MSGPGLLPGENAARDPRPQGADGTYLCYHDDCEREADIAVPRRVEGEGPDPIGTAVTFCLRHHLAWEVLDESGRSLQSVAEMHEQHHEELANPEEDIEAGLLPEGYGDDYDYDRAGWAEFRVNARALSKLVLYGHPLGEDPPDEDSPLGDDWEHAGYHGDQLREAWETPVERQVADLGMDDPSGAGGGDDS